MDKAKIEDAQALLDAAHRAISRTQQRLGGGDQDLKRALGDLKAAYDLLTELAR